VALTDEEKRGLATIAGHVQRVRSFFGTISAPAADAPVEVWLRYLIEMKRALGNTSNWLSLTACLLAKGYLEDAPVMNDFDVAVKPQGAKGLDIDAMTIDGARVVGEVKTTIPYYLNEQRLGGTQYTSIQKDIDNLQLVDATYKYLFVTDEMTYRAIAHAFASQLEGIQLVLLGARQ